MYQSYEKSTLNKTIEFHVRLPCISEEKSFFDGILAQVSSVAKLKEIRVESATPYWKKISWRTIVDSDLLLLADLLLRY